MKLTCDRQRSNTALLVIDTIPALIWSILPNGPADFINTAHTSDAGFSLALWGAS
jgi:hypothetical protein